MAVREAAIESVRALDAPTGAFESFGFEQAMRLFSQVVADHRALLARMMGERQILAEDLVELVALRMSTDPMIDVRPRLLLHAAHAAVTVVWLMAYANRDLDRMALLRDAFEMLESGMGPAMSVGALQVVR